MNFTFEESYIHIENNMVLIQIKDTVYDLSFYQIYKYYNAASPTQLYFNGLPMNVLRYIVNICMPKYMEYTHSDYYRNMIQTKYPIKIWG